MIGLRMLHCTGTKVQWYAFLQLTNHWSHIPTKYPRYDSRGSCVIATVTWHPTLVATVAKMSHETSQSLRKESFMNIRYIYKENYLGGFSTKALQDCTPNYENSTVKKALDSVLTNTPGGVNLKPLRETTHRR